MSLPIKDVREFLSAYPRMVLRPMGGDETAFEGLFDFSAAPADGLEITDAYALRIEVPEYPAALPMVFETAGRIPRNIDDHVYPQTGNLCLGSHLRLRIKIGSGLNLLKFADECIVPYLYATTRRQSVGSFVFGELPHGTPGLFQDYQDIFGLSDEASVLATLGILATKPTCADRHPCPCGCGRRHALCLFRDRVNEIRGIAPRKYFQALYQSMRSKSSGGKM